MGWILAAMGSFAVVGATLDLDFFFEHRKARFFVNLFGRTGTRVFYFILGIAIVVLGVLLGLGIIENSR